MVKYWVFIFLISLTSALFPQKWVILGAQINIGNGEFIPNGHLAFEKGTITYVGETLPDTTGATVVHAHGKQVYPIFILPASTLGLRETDAVRATLDYQEVGLLNPNTRTQIAYNTDSELIPTIRANGIGLAQVAPKGGLLAGQSSVMRLDGWNWEEATLVKDDAMHLFWPSLQNSTGWWEDGKASTNEARNKSIETLHQAFADAKTYSKSPKTNTNLKLEAIAKVLEGEQALFIHADHSAEIVEAITFCKTFSISRKVIVGAENCQKAIPLLSETKTPVVLTRAHSLPPFSHKPIDHIQRLCVELIKSGILVSLSYIGDMEVMGSRNFPFTAGSLVPYGLSKEQALMLITQNPAKILGIDNKWGALEIGKSASLFISTGDALDIKTNQVEAFFLDGKPVEIESKHSKLYKRYKEKYGLE